MQLILPFCAANGKQNAVLHFRFPRMMYHVYVVYVCTAYSWGRLINHDQSDHDTLRIKIRVQMLKKLYYCTSADKDPSFQIECSGLVYLRGVFTNLVKCFLYAKGWTSNQVIGLGAIVVTWNWLHGYISLCWRLARW